MISDIIGTLIDWSEYM